MIDQRRRLAAVGTLLDLAPQIFQKTDICSQLLVRSARRGSPHNETTAAVFALALDDSLQPLAFFFGCDLARHARVIHRRHKHQEASWQRNVTGDARAFFPDWLLRNLDQHFLPFLEQFADLRHHLVLPASEAASTAPSAAPIGTALRPATLRPLQ